MTPRGPLRSPSSLAAPVPEGEPAEGRVPSARDGGRPLAAGDASAVLGEPWPQGISRRATMRISDVLASLAPEFPAVSHSKLRFLEEQGLVEPVRTASGYRQYSLADVERIRFVLVEQRDRYLPLKVIKDKLLALDRGDAPATGRPAPRPVAPPSDALDEDALAAAAGREVSFVRGLVDSGVIRARSNGRFDPWTRQVVVLAAGLAEHGVEARHLRALRTAAERQADLVSQVVAPLLGQTSPSARARAGTLAAEVGEDLAQLQVALIRQAVAELVP